MFYFSLVGFINMAKELSLPYSVDYIVSSVPEYKNLSCISMLSLTYEKMNAFIFRPLIIIELKISVHYLNQKLKIFCSHQENILFLFYPLLKYVDFLKMWRYFIKMKIYTHLCTYVHTYICITLSSSHTNTDTLAPKCIHATHIHILLDETAFHIALIPLGKVCIQLFSLQLWVFSEGWNGYLFSEGEPFCSRSFVVGSEEWW